MTGILNLTGRLLKGALVGGIIALMGGCGILSVIGTLWGYGPLMGPYFIGYVVYYAIPVGLLVGAVISIFRMARKSPERISTFTGIWIALLLAGLVVMVVIPHLVIGEERMITHGATWAIEAEGERECAVPVVRLYLTEYAHYEDVCSAAVLEMLENGAGNEIPITYRMTYDFGDLRGYSLRKVGNLETAPREWLGGGNACGRAPFLTCNNGQVQNERMYYESSWVE